MMKNETSNRRSDFDLLFKNWKYTIYIVFFLLLLFCVFQDTDLNRDRANYISLLTVIKQNGLFYSFLVFEPFFALLASLLSVLSDELYYQSFFSITALISLLIKLNVANKYKCNYFIFFVLFISYYYFVHEVTQVRAGLAIGLFYLAVYFYIYRKYALFFIVGLIASLCHYSCIIFLFVPLLISHQPDRYFYLKYGFLFCLLPFFIFSDGWVFNIVETLGQALNLQKIDSNINLLKNTGMEKSDALIRLLPQVPLLIFSSFYFRYIKKDKVLFVLFQLYLLFFISVVYLSELYVIAFRIGDIFLVSSIFIFSRMYFMVKQRYIFSTFLVCLSSVILVNVLRNVFI